MTIEDFEEKFNEVLVNKRNVNLKDLQPETRFIDLGLNSLDMIDVIIDFEKTFNIAIPDEDIEKLICLSDAEKYLKNMLNIN
ncbi:MAG: acyl carrier protein [Bacteroidia bacterium]|nr:acyl carrier protein [Bacteroidia bacterium]